MAPFALVEVLGKPLAYLVYLVIGIGFGAALEVAGFANSRKLANQFYLKDMTVLKVMFTAIVTAMVLIFLASAAGWLDFNRVFVNPTYLVPGIVGGLIMGVGFVLGGFCPGTSLVAVASLKIDGIFFFLGLLVGVFLFGETVHLFDGFWNSTNMGRLTIPDWLGLQTGVVVLGVVLMALFMFWGAEKLEAHFGETRAPHPGRRQLHLAGAGSLAVLALLVMGMGQPTPKTKWDRVADEKQPLIENREIQIAPGELIALAGNNQIRLRIIDVRDERDYNLFHLVDSRRVSLEPSRSADLASELLGQPANTVVVLVSNDEERATEAWKLLTGESVLNTYLLEGGINGWLEEFEPVVGCDGCARLPESRTPGQMPWAFDAALGSGRPLADPDTFADLEIEYTPKVTLEVRSGPTGGCG